MSIGLGLLVAAISVGAHAVMEGEGFGSVGWRKIPSITVVCVASDPRIVPLQQAVEYWNKTFAELGSPFRLGKLTFITGSVTDTDVQALGSQVIDHTWWPTLPESMKRFPGDLLIVLSDAKFISYSARREGRVVVAIKNASDWPLTLPNVLQNVVAHELGHAVGLEHDQDPTLLMCGRPASCRPDAFQSDTPRFFPLSSDERNRLLVLYPKDWTARR